MSIAYGATELWPEDHPEILPCMQCNRLRPWIRFRKQVPLATVCLTCQDAVKDEKRWKQLFASMEKDILQVRKLRFDQRRMSAQKAPKPSKTPAPAPAQVPVAATATGRAMATATSTMMDQTTIMAVGRSKLIPPTTGIRSPIPSSDLASVSAPAPAPPHPTSAPKYPFASSDSGRLLSQAELSTLRPQIHKLPEPIRAVVWLQLNYRPARNPQTAPSILQSTIYHHYYWSFNEPNKPAVQNTITGKDLIQKIPKLWPGKASLARDGVFYVLGLERIDDHTPGSVMQTVGISDEGPSLSGSLSMSNDASENARQNQNRPLNVGVIPDHHQRRSGQYVDSNGDGDGNGNLNTHPTFPANNQASFPLTSTRIGHEKFRLDSQSRGISQMIPPNHASTSSAPSAAARLHPQGPQLQHPENKPVSRLPWASNGFDHTTARPILFHPGGHSAENFVSQPISSNSWPAIQDQISSNRSNDLHSTSFGGGQSSRTNTPHNDNKNNNNIVRRFDNNTGLPAAKRPKVSSTATAISTSASSSTSTSKATPSTPVKKSVISLSQQHSFTPEKPTAERESVTIIDATGFEDDPRPAVNVAIDPTTDSTTKSNSRFHAEGNPIVGKDGSSLTGGFIAPTSFEMEVDMLADDEVEDLLGEIQDGDVDGDEWEILKGVKAELP